MENYIKMTVEELENYIEEGDTLFKQSKFRLFKPMTWVSKIIYNIIKLPNHVCSVYFIDYKWVTIGAIDPKVAIRTLKEECKSGDIITIKRNSKICVRAKKDFMISKIGIPYDYSSLLFFQLIYQYTKIWLGLKGEKANNKYYCYELEADANGINIDPINPDDLYYYKNFVTILENIKIA